MRHVLFVSDDDTEIDRGRDLLTHLGFEVHVADTLEEVVQVYEVRQPDLFIVDVEMNDGAGFAAIESVCDLTEECFVIAVTRGAHENLWPMVGFACGADAYIVGPLDARKLEDALKKNGTPISVH